MPKIERYIIVFLLIVCLIMFYGTMLLVVLQYVDDPAYRNREWTPKEKAKINLVLEKDWKKHTVIWDNGIVYWVDAKGRKGKVGR